jgi:hypothetical protein
MSWLSAAIGRNKKHAGAISTALSAVPVIGGGLSAATNAAFASSGGKKKKSNTPKRIAPMAKYRHEKGFNFNG